MTDGNRNVRICGRCGCRVTRVSNGRDTTGVMRRTRECANCGNRWTTVEIDEWLYDLMDSTIERAEGILKAPNLGPVAKDRLFMKELLEVIKKHIDEE